MSMDHFNSFRVIFIKMKALPVDMFIKQAYITNLEAEYIKITKPFMRTYRLLRKHSNSVECSIIMAYVIGNFAEEREEDILERGMKINNTKWIVASNTVWLW